MMWRPCASSAFALARTEKAVSVPRRDMRLASFIFSPPLPDALIQSSAPDARPMITHRAGENEKGTKKGRIEPQRHKGHKGHWCAGMEKQSAIVTPRLNLSSFPSSSSFLRGSSVSLSARLG